MKRKYHANGELAVLSMSANDTYAWANKPGACWPCSTLAGRRFVAEFDSYGDLIDFAINGGRGNQDCDAAELNAITDDFRQFVYRV